MAKTDAKANMLNWGPAVMLVGANRALRMYRPTVEITTVSRPLDTEALDPSNGPRVAVSATVPPLLLSELTLTLVCSVTLFYLMPLHN